MTANPTTGFAYRAYGLAIRSELPLPELAPEIVEQDDVAIRLRPTGRTPVETLQVNTFDIAGRDKFLAWPLVGAYLIREDRTIDVEPAPGVPISLLSFPLLGPVMALLLHSRGSLVLHASAVASGRDAVIFLGEKGAGKSTTAAAFVSGGRRLVTDDVLALEFGPAGVLIPPAFPQIKLAADAELAIDLNAEAQPLVLPEFEKRQHRLTGAFSQVPTRPVRIYVLQRGERPGLQRLAPDASLQALIKFSYVTRFHSRPLTGEDAARHLSQCARLAGSVPVCRLTAPTGLHRLDELIALVEKDLECG